MFFVQAAREVTRNRAAMRQFRFDQDVVRTSTIAYRVADFLRSHAPFQYTPEPQLVELARSGRVKFYEVDEYIFRQGEGRKPWIYVIQQGRVELWEEEEGRDELRDILGAGDMLGIGAFWGDPPQETYLYSAKTTGDVVLYALGLDAFSRVVKEQPRIKRYLNAYFSVNPIYVDGEGERALIEFGPEVGPPVMPLHALARGGRVRVRSRDTVADVVRRTVEAGRDTLAMVDDEGRELGVVWTPELMALLAAGERSWEAPAASAATAQVVDVDHKQSIEATHLAMLRARRFVGLVRGDDGKPMGAISPTDIGLLPLFNPALVGRRLRRAADTAEAEALIAQAKLSIAAALTDRSHVAYLADVSTELHSLLVERLGGLAEAEMAAEDWIAPEGSSCCWLLFGSAGRGELLTWHDLDSGLAYEAPDADPAAAQAYFLELGRRVTAALQACGFTFSATAQRPDKPAYCQSLRSWKNQFSSWVRDPVRSSIYGARSMFDMQYAAGNRNLLNELRRHIGREVTVWESFIQLLAYDTLAHLPPVTFFDGLVVESEGRLHETLDLRRSAIFPLSDSARVWGLATGSLQPASATRFQHAKHKSPERAKLLDSAVEALRVALYHRGRVGLRDHTNGAELSPRELSKLDQQLLKSAFRTAAEMLEATAERFQVAAGGAKR